MLFAQLAILPSQSTQVQRKTGAPKPATSRAGTTMKMLVPPSSRPDRHPPVGSRNSPLPGMFTRSVRLSDKAKTLQCKLGGVGELFIHPPCGCCVWRMQCRPKAAFRNGCWKGLRERVLARRGTRSIWAVRSIVASVVRTEVAHSGQLYSIIIRPVAPLVRNPIEGLLFSLPKHLQG